jgi:hypothetical protein
MVHGTQCRSLLYRTLCPLQSRLLHIYHGQSYARVDLCPLPESTLTLCQSRLYAPVEDFRFDLLPCLKVGSRVHTAHTVRVAGDWCCQFRISTCTVFISESVVSPFLTPVTGARRRQQSLPAECG